MDVRLPNGKIMKNVPAGTSKGQIAQKAIQSGFAKPEDFGLDPMEYETSGVEKALAGAGKAFVDLARGGEQLVRGIFPGESERERELEEEISLAQERDRPLMSDPYGMGGNIAGNIAALLPSAAIPGAGTYLGSTAIGAGAGALMPTSGNQSRGENIATGAAGGAIGRGLAGGLSRIIGPRTPPQTSQMLNEGVELTPGQAAGGVFQRGEDMASSLPLVGDIIRSGQRRGIESFNKAAINRALRPIGEKAEKIGYEGVEEAYEKVSGAYKDLLPKLKAVVDDPFMENVDNLTRMATKGLPEKEAKRFTQILDNDVLGEFVGDGRMSGETMKRIDSKLGNLIRSYKKKGGDDAQLGDALKELQSELRGLVNRSNPDYKGQLSAIDEAYANLLRVEGASGMQGAATRGGVFTPANLSSSVKRFDQSQRGRAFSQGNALMQDLSNAGKQTLTQTVPDSGTPGRLMMNAGLLGGGAYLDPLVTGGLLTGAAGAYSRPGSQILNTLITRRPDMMRQIGQNMEQLYPLAAPAAGGVLLSQ